MADGFGGGQTARATKIMRDSRIGSYGVMGVDPVVARMWALIARWIIRRSSYLPPSACRWQPRRWLPFWLARMPAARPNGLGHGSGAGGLRPCVYVAVPLVLFGVLPLGFRGRGCDLAGVVVSTALI